MPNPGETRKIRILMLEDEAADAELASQVLREGGVDFSLTQVQTKETFLNELRDEPPDLILSDNALPTFDSPAALALTKAESPDTPFILFTGSLRDEGVIDILESGAVDCVLKHQPSDLVRAVRRAMRETEERIRRKQ